MANETPRSATIETSKKFSVNMPDFLRSSLTALYTALASVALQFMDTWINNPTIQFDMANLKLSAKIAVAAWIGDLIRRFLKSSATVIRVQPSDKTVTLMDDESGTEIPTKPPPNP